MSASFIKTKENFKCENCDHEVVGTGYTNHCPICLWSKHVDINPGDRSETCGGLMEPVGIEKRNGEYLIIHQCQKCGIKKKNKSSKDDNFEEILKLANF